MNQIATMRKQIGVSQAQLAKTIGWGTSRLANYELSIRTPSLNDCRKIVNGLTKLGCECSIDDIFPPPSDASNSIEANIT
ncbi:MULTISPECIES: helix-turn-helix transcriptional regulator [unclassified Pantoea]|uniref:helix-turn-helix transcriptional regulator n=1 Tax=unclassified Pantoea TaxID=2630326 RepID=UPI001CD47AFB|nr:MULTISPECIES: helix-turn-helix transcriptional regulator [unclassified Pantoea]MCA1176677.1 helix-turn-helix domain-containing protein [Pantoea sp. alder69]MCA1251590.1 helix-turn-helix domain-containing protein [Pantoea sp. alder70]MCA1264279.1 helix-turn-helix domain-containing protein [Pantoea sp. alder81]